MGSQSKYDLVTRWLHAFLALGIVAQLVLSAVMHVPPGPGLGVFDWHREAFEIHARVGLAVATVCGLYWLWVVSPLSRPPASFLYPWMLPEKRRRLLRELVDLLRLKVPSAHEFSPLAGTVHGLGLAAVTGSAAGGIVNYFGYFVGLPIPRIVLHIVSEWHIVMGYLVLVFVIGHVSMALLHRLADGSIGFGRSSIAKRHAENESRERSGAA